ncbi:MAG: hypothetical protein FK730_14575 [Asgard group archaeon]|nr:hypothetical protein [Asgard group archaeon]
MKNLSKKICSFLIFFVIIGTVFSNINFIASIIPKNEIERSENKVDNHVVNDNEFDLGYEIILEIDTYFRKEANNNNFKIRNTVYSTGLKFEIGDSLVIIGHGYFDKDYQYCIADYTTNEIIQLARNKEWVALLACYSSNVELENELPLTYNGQVNLQTAVTDLITLLGWYQSSKYTPLKNIILDYFDPGGGGGGGGSVPEFSEGLKYAYTGWGGGYYWNLNTEAGFLGVGNFLIANRGIMVNVFISNYYYEEISEGSYQLIIGETTFNAWVIRKSDMQNYIHMEDFVIDGESNNDEYEGKLNDIKDVLDDDVFLAGVVVSAAFALAAVLTTVGVTLIKMCKTTKPILITVTELGSEILGLAAGPYILMVPSINYILLIVGIVLIIIAVLVITAFLVYALYNLMN